MLVNQDSWIWFSCDTGIINRFGIIVVFFFLKKNQATIENIFWFQLDSMLRTFSTSGLWQVLEEEEFGDNRLSGYQAGGSAATGQGKVR